MSRRHVDPVEVRTRTSATGPVPEQFLWQGRLYLVREVLARWTESGSWWRGASVRALTEGERPASTGVDDRETQRWRVEADSGRLAALSGGRGVYDLCFEDATARWTLTRVMD
ncbi:MAG: DUF6504 family protein [Mycobacteriales bacterium]